MQLNKVSGREKIKQMGFASAYLEERALFPEIIKEAPDKHTGIIVVVPAYNEPGYNNAYSIPLHHALNRNAGLK